MSKTTLTKSSNTLHILKEIDKIRVTIQAKTDENKLLKKLCFHKGELHRKASIRLEGNAEIINRHIDELKVQKQRLQVSFENDYQNMINGTDKKVSFKLKVFKPVFCPIQTKEQEQVLSVFNEAREKNIDLGFDIFKSIGKVLNIRSES